MPRRRTECELHAGTVGALARILFTMPQWTTTLSLFGALLLTLAACHAPSTARIQPEASAVTTTAGPTKVGTDPGHVGHGTPLTPRQGNELAAFAAGCFWGVEDTFRH